MCGFAGFLTFGPTPTNAVERHRILVSMGNAVAHRGPDDAQYYDDGTLALVYRRLSIIDVQGGRQPFFNERGDELLVANGEIYNHGALRAALAPHHQFTSMSDCEVLLHGFEQWGNDALQRAHGMFAVAHWSLRERKLTLGRDRLGIKPLYVCRLSHGLLFGSELKALLAHPDCPRNIAWPDVDRPLISQPQTASYVRSVDLLPGGDCMVIDVQGRSRTYSYWRLQDHLGTAPFGANAQRYPQAYGDLLQEVTLQHMQRDVGAGIHLSGGVDSSLIAGIVAAHDKNVPCFTVVERSNYLGGDVDMARRLTGRLGLPWCPVRFDYRSIVQDMQLDLSRLEQAVWMMDSPRLEIEWLFKEELHRVARDRFPGLKVILLGQGADEFAGGYSLRANAQRQSWDDYIREEIRPNLVFDESLRGEVTNSLWALAKHSSKGGARAPYHEMMPLFARQLQHHNLWHEDRTSSWHSLEARVPFLDHRLVELLASVPSSLHNHLFWNKRIVRDALERFIPGHGLQQPKIGFIDGQDSTSHEVMLHSLLRAVVPAFRDKYVAAVDSPFDARKIDALIQRAFSRGPHRGMAAKELLQCMAISIFERQLREPPSKAHFDERVCLRLMTSQDWAVWSSNMASPPKCKYAWQPCQRVELHQGVEILKPLRTNTMRFCFLRDGALAGEVTLDDPNSWPAVFLKNLDTRAVADFTVQDWLDEFEIDLGELGEMLDVLYHQGVIRAADGPARTLTALKFSTTEAV